jgi:SOS-response transcriptional repressor LexA
MTTTSEPQLTRRQLELLATISRLTADRGGVPPTLKETGAAMSPPCHWTNVRSLARKCQQAGRLDYRPRTARSWVVVERQEASR